MLQQSAIETAQIEWSSFVELAPKRNVSRKFCIDYRRLNANRICDTYPILRMDDREDFLGEVTWFSTFNADFGYWQAPIAEEDCDKTMFPCQSGKYKFCYMPSGLTNA